MWHDRRFPLGLVVMLYLLFFLLRDGSGLSKRIQDAIPLPPEQERELFRKFTTVIRATIKGSSILVAALQGALGGLYGGSPISQINCQPDARTARARLSVPRAEWPTTDPD